MRVRRKTVSCFILCMAVLALDILAWPVPACFAKTNAPLSLAERVAERRFTATRPFSAEISGDDAAVVAAAAATDAAMQYLIRLLAALPEVRISAPNLLALAHASAETEVLLVSRSRRKSTVTVTVVFRPSGENRAIESRVRETLIRPGRLALYEEAVLREKELCNAYDRLFSPSGPDGRERDAEAATAIVNELKALRLFIQLLPQWNGIWQNPAETREILKNALRLAPESPLLHNAAGDASLQLGRSQEAVEEHTAAIRLRPSFARAYHSRGTARLALGLLSSSAADFSEAIRLSPHSAAYYRDRAMARHLLGETTAMCQDLYEACTRGDCEKMQWAAEKAYCPSISP